MYYQKRGGTFSFVYYDTELKRNVRLSKSKHPVVTDIEAAAAFCLNWNAQYDAMKTRIEKRIEWTHRYHNFVELLKLYERSRKEEAPNSWDDNIYQLKYYVFPFFLAKKSENNINNWHYHFEEFRDFLETVEPIKKKVAAQTIAYSTKNNIIAALNAFITIMHRRRQLENDYKCRQFSNSKLNRKSEESVVDPEFQKLIFDKLMSRNELAAAFFLVSIHTGMRISELLGLSLADFLSGAPDSEVIRKALEPYELKSYGFISIDSQPSSKSSSLRGVNGRINRKPLKGKKRIDPEDARIIPIFDKDAYNAIVDLWNKQRELYNTSKRFGEDLKNYLLFDGLNKNSFSRHLRQAQKSLHLEVFFTPHDARHTYSTWLAEQTGGNYAMCRMILGHSNVNITMRYIHMQARLQRQLKSKIQLKEPLRLAG